MQFIKQHLPFIAILVLAFALRIYKIDRYGLFFDEKATLLTSQSVCLGGGANQKDIFGQKTFSPKDFWKAKTPADFNESIARNDIGNSPFYYVLLMQWIHAFGVSDMAIRMFSLLFSVLFVGMLYHFCRVHFKDQKIALIASFLASIEPFFIAMSHQARNYSLTFFLTLLATHVFLLILNKNRQGWYYLAYGALVGLSLLSHFLAFTVFLGHGLYGLFYAKSIRQRLLLLISGIFGVLFLVLWMVKGGGTYTLYTLDSQAKLYREIAQRVPNPHAGYIDPATFKNVFSRAIPIYLDLSVFSNSVFENLVGKKNVLVAFLLSILAFCCIKFDTVIKRPFNVLAMPTLFLAAYFAFSTQPLYFLILAAWFVLCYLFIADFVSQKNKKDRLLLILLSVLPSAILMMFSFKNGHTFGLTPRYQGFAFPFAFILLAMLLIRFWQLKMHLKIPLMIVFVIQLWYVKDTILKIYSDTSGKYSYFQEARLANPYIAIAQTINQVYTPGDTLIYPSFTGGTYKEKADVAVSYLDAQMVNVYLPKNATYLQKVDPTEPNKLLLARKDGSVKVIFDFKDKKYRY